MLKQEAYLFGEHNFYVRTDGGADARSLSFKSCRVRDYFVHLLTDGKRFVVVVNETSVKHIHIMIALVILAKVNEAA